MQTENINEESRFLFYKKYGKRIFDTVLSITLVVLLFPIFLIISFFIKIDSLGPVIYKQKRVGKNANSFFIYKFRTMVVNADRIGDTSTTKGDSRITRLGNVLRRYSLDELPQLINVIKGDMSLVGYRPGVDANYSEEELQEGYLFKVKPGITGYAQINGRSNITLDAKREWEKKYIREISFYTDLKIIIKTIGVVLKSDNTI